MYLAKMGKGHMLIWSENSLRVKWIYDWIAIKQYHGMTLFYDILFYIIDSYISLQGYFHSRLACGPYQNGIIPWILAYYSRFFIRIVTNKAQSCIL